MREGGVCVCVRTSHTHSHTHALVLYIHDDNVTFRSCVSVTIASTEAIRGSDGKRGKVFNIAGHNTQSRPHWNALQHLFIFHSISEWISTFWEQSQTCCFSALQFLLLSLLILHSMRVVPPQKAQERGFCHPPSQIVQKSFLLLETDMISIPATLICWNRIWSLRN